MTDPVQRKRDVGCELVERLRVEHGDVEPGAPILVPAGYVAALERHAAEGIRVNVGLMAENAELKRRLGNA